MTETVRRVVALSSGDRFVMVMPDTYFHGQAPYQHLVNSQDPMFLACWNIRPEQFGKLGQVEINYQDSMSGTESSHGFVVKSEDKNPNCRFPFSWGAMAFDRGLIELAKDEMPHTGYMIPKALEQEIPVGASVMEGEYFDCGTPTEYLAMLKKVTN
jgi:hypothetical protein